MKDNISVEEETRIKLQILINIFKKISTMWDNSITNIEANKQQQLRRCIKKD